jgi:hypothetical protein
MVDRIARCPTAALLRPVAFNVPLARLLPVIAFQIILVAAFKANLSKQTPQTGPSLVGRSSSATPRTSPSILRLQAPRFIGFSWSWPSERWEGTRGRATPFRGLAG